MTAPNIPHASTCTDPKVELTQKYMLWESMAGNMYRLIYGCVACGETAQIERFEAFRERFVEED